MAGRKVFEANEILTAANVNDFLMDQSVMVFADEAARTTSIPTPTAGMYAHLLSDDTLYKYNGTDWVAVGAGASFTADRAIISNGSGELVVSDVTATEIAHLDGVTSAVQTQLDARALVTPAVNAKTSAYTLVLGDRGEFITASGTFTITIPSAIFSAGDRVDFVNIGTGTITFAGSGVTVNSVEAALTIDTQWAGATFFFTSASAGVLIGKLA
jgi:hypothetical protein